jgi:branched-chain amino acid transport system substrate-binding protein
MNRWMLGFALAVVTVACGQGAPPEGTPGVTEDTIRVGMTADLTGPIAFLGQEISAGIKLCFQQVNDRGGVNGRKLELLVEDDGYQPPRTIAAYRKLLDRDHVFAFVGNIGTSPNMALKPMLERDRVPTLAVSYSSAVYTPPSRYLFAQDPSYRMTSWIMLEYLVDKLGVPGAKIGVIYQDDDLGLDGLAGVREAAAHYGLTIVAEEGYKRGAIDFSSQVLNLKKAGATHVVLWTTLRESAAVLKKAQELDWTPEFLGWFVVADPRFVELAGDAAAHLHIVNLFDLDSDDPRIRVYRDAIDQYDPGHKPGFYHAGGFSLGQIFVEALERAGRDLTREKLIDALETFDRWDQDVLGRPVTYGPGLRGGSVAKTFISKVDLEQGKLVRVTEDTVFEMPEP